MNMDQPAAKSAVVTPPRPPGITSVRPVRSMPSEHPLTNESQIEDVLLAMELTTRLREAFDPSLTNIGEKVEALRAAAWAQLDYVTSVFNVQDDLKKQVSKLEAENIVLEQKLSQSVRENVRLKDEAVHLRAESEAWRSQLADSKSIVDVLEKIDMSISGGTGTRQVNPFARDVVQDRQESGPAVQRAPARNAQAGPSNQPRRS